MKRCLAVPRFVTAFAATALCALLVLPATAQQRAGRPAPEGVEVQYDVPYTSVGERVLHVDIARPAQIPEEPMPVIVHIHGGGFRAGQKSPAPNFPYAQVGYFTISVEYRLSGEAIFPAAAKDCKAAIQWLRANAEVLHINPDKIGVWGSSAGGHLAAFLGASNGVEEFDWPTAKGHSSDVQCVVDEWGPSDFPAMVDQKSAINRRTANAPESMFLGGLIEDKLELAIAASPVTYVDGNEPPFLIIHGTEDMTVPFGQSEILNEALQKVGADVTFIPVKNAGHGIRGENIEPSREEIAKVQMEFFDKHLKGK